MDESEKRKERLKAMRMEASQSGDYNEAVGYGGLTNPLTDVPSGNVESYAMPRPRFDYYTDPMAAFSANKRSNNQPHVSPQVSQQCYTRATNPQSPICTPRGNYSVDQRSQGVHHTFNPLGNPGQNSPFGIPQRGSPSAWNNSFDTPKNYLPPNSSMGGNFASPGTQRGGRPGFHYGQGSGQPGSGYGGSPYRGSGYRGNPYEDSGHRGSPSQGSGHRGSPYQHSGNRGSPYQHLGNQGSPYQGSGQGRSQWRGNSSSPFSFRGGRRGGRGSHGGTSGESRPDLYFSKSMVEDPWKELKPVIWKAFPEKPWLPHSISAKKTKFPDAPVKSIPQQSLAECLAASFNEAASSEAATDGSGT